MSILVNKNTKLLVQGITGRDGQFHALKMKQYGTNVVAGTSPGKGGETVQGAGYRGKCICHFCAGPVCGRCHPRGFVCRD